MYSGVQNTGRDDGPADPVPEGVPFHQQLRDATRADHDAVDAAYAGMGIGDALGYARFLTAHARILPAMEQAADPATLLPGWTTRAPLLRDDLAELGLDMPEPLPVHVLADRAARWGAIYVMEGSRLGGAMLARGVPAGLPSRYLSAVHGPGGWRDIRQAIDTAMGDTDWQTRAIAAARATFAAWHKAAHG
jgi:heme oxygenase